LRILPGLIAKFGFVPFLRDLCGFVIEKDLNPLAASHLLWCVLGA